MDTILATEDWVKILLALLVGGIIGMEREFRDKAAGFRTLIFICLGSVLFTILSTRLPGEKDNSRLAAGIVTGIGFLGAGVILRQGGHITGLTTAATIWLTAALGVAIGTGEYSLSLISAGIAVIVLEVFPWLEKSLNRLRDERKYEIAYNFQSAKTTQLLEAFCQNKIKVISLRQYKDENRMVYLIDARGSYRNHHVLIERLLADPEILSLKY